MDEAEVGHMVRKVLDDHAGLAVPAQTLPADADLFAAGMSSFASVDVMLAVEDACGITFPDAMLQRSLLVSVSSITAAIMQLLAVEQ